MAAEKDFENKVKDFLQSEGIYPSGFPENKMTRPSYGWYVKIWGGGYQSSGIPDMIINVRGHFVGAELKGETGRPSELQKLNLTRIRESEGFGFVLYPSAFNEFKEFIRNLKHDEWNRDSIPLIWKNRKR